MWCVANVSTFPNTFLVVSPLTCTIWIKLTRANGAFSRITFGVYFCAEINFPRKFPEIHENYIFTEDSWSPKDNWRGATGPPRGCQAPPWPRLVGLWEPRATSPSPLRYLGHFVPETKNTRRIFANTIQSSTDTRNPSLGFRSSCSGTLPGRGLAGRSSPSSSPTPLHQPSMIPPLMCE